MTSPPGLHASHHGQFHPLQLGPFLLETVLGKGGMGEVWSGIHPAESTPVAIKVLTRLHARSPHFQAAFRHEVQAMAGLHHLHICAIYDHGIITEGTQAQSNGHLVAGSPWLAMERCEQTLQPLQGTLDWPTLRRMLLELLDALSHAHARGVIHRDIKPANVLLLGDHVKLTDFGLAHAGEDSATAPVGNGGTPVYMAPEQAHNAWRDFGPPTDLFALGGTAWALATGAPPFSSHRRLQTLLEGGTLTPPAFRPARPMPVDLEPWLRCLLAADPRQRFQTAADAAWALLQVAGPLKAAAPPTFPLEPALSGETLAVEGPEIPAPGKPGAWGDTLSLRLQTVDFEVEPPSPSPSCETPTPVARQPSSPPPLADLWRRSSAPPSLRLQGVGLGLYGLREVPLVGRETEQRALWDAFSTVCTQKRSRAMVLEGEAGIGKSRLAAWVSRQAQELGIATVLRASHANPAGAADGLVPMLERHLRVRGLTRPQVAARVQRLLGLESPGKVGELTELLFPQGQADPQGVTPVTLKTPQERTAVLRETLHRLSQHRPLILWLDDVQWGLPALELAQQVLDQRPSSPLFLVLTVRAETLEMADDVRTALSTLLEHPSAQSVKIHPLSPDNRTALVRDLLGLSSALVDQVAVRTGGNPLFATQLVGDWVERGALVARGETFVLAEGVSVPIPDAIHGLWTDRLAQLLQGHPDADRRALELAALLGVEVEEREWEEACAKAGIVPSPAMLEAMLRRGLAHPREDGWAFSHGLLAESITRIAQEQGRLDEAQHCVGAVLLARGIVLEEQGESPRAVSLLARAEALLAPSSHRRLWMEALTHVTFCQRTMGQMEQALAGLTTVLEAARALNDRWMEGVALGEIGGAYVNLGQYTLARDYMEQSLALHRAEGNRYREGVVLGGLGKIQVLQGQIEEARTSFEAALLIRREVGNLLQVATVLTNLGNLLQDQGKHDAAMVYYEEALTLFRETGNRNGEAILLVGIAIVYLDLGQRSRTEPYLQRALALAIELHARRVEATSRDILGYVKFEDGQYEEALVHFRECLRISNEIGYRENLCNALGNMGSVFLATGRIEDALEHFNQSLDLARELGSPRNEGILLARLGDISLSQNRLDEAQAHYEHSIALLREVEAPIFEAESLGLLGETLGRKGEFTQGREALTAGAARLRYTDYKEKYALLLCRMVIFEQAAGNLQAAQEAFREAFALAQTLKAVGTSTELGRKIQTLLSDAETMAR